MKIIAVDFDGCLCENAWPKIGRANRAVIEELIQRKAEGDKLILWTCRVGDRLEEAVSWCLNRGLKFDAINDNLPEMIEKFGNNCRKVYAHEYWDDKALQVMMVKDVAVFFGVSKQTYIAPKGRGLIGAIKRWWSRWLSD